MRYIDLEKIHYQKFVGHNVEHNGNIKNNSNSTNPGTINI